MQIVHENCSLNIRKTFFFFNSEGDQTQKVVSHRGCGVPILGGIQNLTGHYPRPLAQSACTWAGGLDKTIFMGAFPPQQPFDSMTLMTWLLWSLTFMPSLVSPQCLLSISTPGQCWVYEKYIIFDTTPWFLGKGRKGRRDETSWPAVFLPSVPLKCLLSIFFLEDSRYFLNRNVTHHFLTEEQKNVLNPQFYMFASLLMVTLMVCECVFEAEGYGNAFEVGMD